VDIDKFKELFEQYTNFENNKFHPFVKIAGKPIIGNNVNIGFFSEINAKNSKIEIGDNCDIASFVSINSADSHKKCLDDNKDIERKEIILKNNVFVGSHCLIKGGAQIGHHTVIAAGTIVDGIKIPPFSLVSGNPMKIKEGYYKNKCVNRKD
jgi:acetyltransferase-like isoleucine patch superfamily enzyme